MCTEKVPSQTNDDAQGSLSETFVHVNNHVIDDLAELKKTVKTLDKKLEILNPKLLDYVHDHVIIVMLYALLTCMVNSIIVAEILDGFGIGLLRQLVNVLILCCLTLNLYQVGPFTFQYIVSRLEFYVEQSREKTLKSSSRSSIDSSDSMDDLDEETEEIGDKAAGDATEAAGIHAAASSSYSVLGLQL